MDEYVVRPAEARDIARLREIERAAGEAFRGLGMDLVADDEPPSEDALFVCIDADRAWVVADGSDEAAAYLVAECVDGAAHVEQVSVHPDHAGYGLGRRLIEHLADLARRRGVRSMTLTSYREVPWNAPYYRRLGFEVVDEAEWTPGLRRIRDEEASLGLDRWPRVCMRRLV